VNAGSGGTGIPGQGYKGGSGLRPERSGGGGGAGEPGGDAAGNFAGSGGTGLQYPQFSHAGDGGWFAGGGGGSAYGETTPNMPGSGGLGGGGDGSTTAGHSAIANTGGGGGGGGNGHSGGNGGSGIVIVRYRIVTSISVSGDVSLNIGDGILQAGQGQIEDTDDTSTLSWSSSVEDPDLNKITVLISIGSLPPGLELRLNPQGSTAVVLSDTAQDFILGIGNEFRSEVLAYSLVVTDFDQLFACTEPLTIEYTLAPQ